MMNEHNERTVLRSRRTPFRPSPGSEPERSVNVLPVGTHLGEFEILDIIGEGGFGIVYLVYDHSLERHVALKEYMPSGLATRTTKMAVTVRSQHNVDTFTAGLKSFINEARMLAQFDSPSLVKVHRFWEGNGTAYMVMPFYEGTTLKQALKERRIKPSETWVRLLLADLFDAIEIIHHAHCLHRDIAPDNILLLKDGRPLLLDFGAARRVIGDLTQCLTAILKPGYAPIEQYADIDGLRQGAWTDLYALAAVVYYLIAGKAPPPAVARMVRDELVPAREVGKGRYSDTFLAALDKALSVKPEHRFRSIAEMRRAVDIMETVPRTLPSTSSDLATTVIRTAPLADAKPEAAPNAKPAAKPNAKPESKPEAKREVKPEIKPAAEQKVKAEARPEAKANVAQDVKPAIPREAEPQMQPGARPATEPDRDYWKRRPGTGVLAEHGVHGKPSLLILGLLLIAGIASGVYWGLNRSAPDSPERSLVTAGNKPLMESSGSSGASDEETENKTAPPAVAPAPASPSPPAAANTAPAPRTGNAATSKPGRAQGAAPEAPVPSEIELWRMASATDKASAYHNYLRAYPKGRYAALARLRLERMQPKTAAAEPSVTPPVPETKSRAAPPAEKPKTATPAAEEELWTTVTAINQAPAYESYLNKFPKGRYAPLARDRLASFKPPEPAAPEPPPPAVQPDVPMVSPPEAKVPEKTDKPASIKAPEATPKPPAEAPVASGKKTITAGNQTMTGNFSADPKTGIVSGTGKIVWSNGDQFEGTLVQGMKEGKGKFSWHNGQRYNGDWVRDMPNGKGAIVFTDGSRYEGEVKDGVPNGQGTTRFKSGDVYDGAWIKGKSHGQGRYTWANGSYWEGEFRDDKRTENGKMVFSESALRAAEATPAMGEAQSAGRRAAD